MNKGTQSTTFFPINHGDKTECPTSAYLNHSGRL